MAQYDPAMKMEQWLFEETRLKTPRGLPSYARLGFNFVSYDGSSTEYVEPVSESSMAADRDSGPSGASCAMAAFQYIRKGLAPEFFAVNDFGTV